MTPPERVVFDCNVLFQAFLSANGPAGSLLAEAARGSIVLFLSEGVIAEITGVLSRPHLVAKFNYNPQRAHSYAAKLREIARVIESPPHVFDFPRDPDDAQYIDLAVAASASLIVSHDKDLLSLRDRSTPEGRDFATRFPEIDILTPPEALLRVRNR